jgi:transposase InsO family protein
LSDQESYHELPALPIVVDARAGGANGSWLPAFPVPGHVDETYLKVASEWCCLYRAIDRDGTLVDVALDMALKRRRPLPGLMHHSDRGSQYAAGAYQKRLAEHGVVCSMSRKGNCWEPVRVSEANMHRWKAFSTP